MIDLKKYVNVTLDTSAPLPTLSNSSNVVFVEALQNLNASYQYEGLVTVDKNADIDKIYNRKTPNNTGPQFHNAYTSQFSTFDGKYYICALDPNESEGVYRGGQLPSLTALFDTYGYHYDDDSGKYVAGVLYGADNVKKVIFPDISLSVKYTADENDAAVEYNATYLIPGAVLWNLYALSNAQYYTDPEASDLKDQYAYLDYTSLFYSAEEINNVGGLKLAISPERKIVDGYEKAFYYLVVATTTKGENAQIKSISTAEIANKRYSQLYAVAKANKGLLANPGTNNEEQQISISFTANGSVEPEKNVTLTIVNAGKIDQLIDQFNNGEPDYLINDINAALSSYTDADATIQGFVNSLRLTMYIDNVSASSVSDNRYMTITSTSANIGEKYKLFTLKDGITGKILEILGFKIDLLLDADQTEATKAGLLALNNSPVSMDVLQGGVVFNLGSGVSQNLPGHGDLVESGKLMKYVQSMCFEKTIDPTHVILSRTLTYDNLMNATDLNKLASIARSFAQYMSDTCVLFLHTSTLEYQRNVVLDGVPNTHLRNIIAIYDPNVGNYVDAAVAKYLASINYTLAGSVRNLLGVSFSAPIAACNITTEQMNMLDAERVNTYALLSTGQAMFQTGYTSDTDVVPYIDMSNGINHMIRTIKLRLALNLQMGTLTIDENGRGNANIIISNVCDRYVVSGLLGDALLTDEAGIEVYVPSYKVYVSKVTEANMRERSFPQIGLVIHCKSYANTINVVISETTNSVVSITTSTDSSN